jgi:putative transposase
MKKPIFENDQIYHIYNRGVEKRQIFMDNFDYYRFVHNLFEFNDTTPAGRFSEFVTPKVMQNKKRDLLVEVLCFCLMPNHFHLILRQRVDNGIIAFMKKIGLGYAMYFNRKNIRVGSLFQGRFKAISASNDEYLLHLSRYIHLNPVELIDPSWKKKGIKSWRLTNDFLKSYRWSSYLDYIDVSNFSSVSSRDFILSYAGSKKQYKEFVESFVVGDLNEIDSTVFD